MNKIIWLEDTTYLSLLIMIIFLSCLLGFLIFNYISKFFVKLIKTDYNGETLFKLIVVDLDLTSFKLKPTRRRVFSRLVYPKKRDENNFIHIYEKRMTRTDIVNIMYILQYSVLVNHKINLQDNLRKRLILFFSIGWFGFFFGILTICLIFVYPITDESHVVLSIILQYFAYLVILLIIIGYIGWTSVQEQFRAEIIKLASLYFEQQTLSKLNKLLLFDSFCFSAKMI